MVVGLIKTAGVEVARYGSVFRSFSAIPRSARPLSSNENDLNHTHSLRPSARVRGRKKKPRATHEFFFFSPFLPFALFSRFPFSPFFPFFFSRFTAVFDFPL